MEASAITLFQTPEGIIVYAAFIVILLAISIIDWRKRRIPNELVTALVVLRFIALIVSGYFGIASFDFTSLISSFINAVALVVLFVILKVVMDKKTGKESLGWGDVKLVAAGTLFLTASQAFFALMVACVAALGLAGFFSKARKDTTFPFGPALCLGFALAFLL